MGANGKRCPEHEHAPQTVEGSLALQIGFAPGAQARAGMAGVVTGLNYAAAMAIAPPGCDQERLAALLLQTEAGMLAGFAKATEQQEGE